ncbi:methyl-accepting chemotaxis protein [Litoribacillus peritrichatus]|uniref:HAMP domain-containing methyl-accepting chemotaxis protein n=1 Tax=Litoribacillus peritrichatus TaxID=718191 RepID=A0ABP7NC64_9GAMM
MVSIKSLSIRSRHLLIIVVVAVGFFLTGWLSHYSSSQLQTLHQINLGVDELEQGMMTLRRNEKDFLNRKDAKYLARFKGTGEQTLTTLSHLKPFLNEYLGEQTQIVQVEHNLTEYIKSFEQLAAYQTEIGTDHKSGLYGSLRASIHDVETIIDGNSLLTANMLMLRRNEKDFMLRRDAKYIQKFDKNLAVMEGNIPAGLHALVAPKLADYQKKFMALYEAEKFIGLTHEQGLHGTLRSAAHQLETLFDSEKEILTRMIADKTQQLSIVLYAALVLLALASVVAVFLISKTISSSLDRLIRHVLSLINDPKAIAQAKRHDNELDVLESAFDSLNQNLTKAITEIKTSAGSISDVATEMAVMTEQVNQSTEEQHCKVEQSATAMEEMSKAIEEVANNAGDTATFVANVTDRLNETTVISGKAQDAIGTLQDELKQSVQAIGALQTTSTDIESLLDSIQDIADQTNMLALNAAIEAARAGDHGRGFAVVADEVRTLSARTHQATEEVRSTLNQFKSVINHVVESVEASSSKGEQGQNQANHAIAMMREMTQKVAEISMMNIQIATSVEEQTAAANELNLYIHDIFESSKSVREHSRETSKATIRLGEVVENINQSASAFAI